MLAACLLILAALIGYALRSAAQPFRKLPDGTHRLRTGRRIHNAARRRRRNIPG